MKPIQEEIIFELTKKLKKVFGPEASSSLQVNLKNDQTLVSEIDLFVSGFLKEKLSKHSDYSNYTFFCEEDFKSYVFPCAILDPIDGTRELVRGRPECAISLALMQTSLITNPSNFAWVGNPLSGFSLDSKTPFVKTVDKSSDKILSFVSRSEFKKGYFNKYLSNPIIDITPRGSIAFKLGLLASGACDFIVSLAPKNVWDIAAGTILCAQRGIYFYENGIRLTTLDRQQYHGALIWVSDLLAPKVLEIFKDEFKN